MKLENIRMQYEDYPLYNHFREQAQHEHDRTWQRICRQKLVRIKRTIDRINEYLGCFQAFELRINPHSLRVDYRDVAQVLDTSFTLLSGHLRHDYRKLISFLEHEIVKSRDIIRNDIWHLASHIRESGKVRIGILTTLPDHPVHDIDIIIR